MKTLAIASCLVLISTQAYAKSSPKAIYGKDNRSEVSQYPNPKFQKLAASVAGRISKYHMYDSYKEGFSEYNKTTLGEKFNACPTERFIDQPAIAGCTGFLVGEDTLVTVGHCMKRESDCDTFKWVFGFDNQQELINNKDAYSCKKVIAKVEKNSAFGRTDYAIIKLDRKVTGRAPLKFRTSGKVKRGTGIVVIGHPLGLPLKIADDASVSKTLGNSFNADLDTYSGNSGSPVFNEETGVVEGILMSGSADLSFGECRSSLTYSFKGNEKVFKITSVDELQELAEQGRL